MAEIFPHPPTLNCKASTPSASLKPSSPHHKPASSEAPPTLCGKTDHGPASSGAPPKEGQRQASFAAGPFHTRSQLHSLASLQKSSYQGGPSSLSTRGSSSLAEESEEGCAKLRGSGAEEAESPTPLTMAYATT